MALAERTWERVGERKHARLVESADILKTNFYHIHTDTVHSAFTFPVDENEWANVNWIISTFYIVIFDEISMIAKHLFEHIITTLNEIPVRPVLLIGGDEQQQQPIDIHGIIVQNKTSQWPPYYTNGKTSCQTGNN